MVDHREHEWALHRGGIVVCAKCGVRLLTKTRNAPCKERGQ